MIYDFYGNLYSLRDGNLNITTYSYDKLNRVRYEYYPGGVNQNYTYYTSQNYIITQDENGNQKKYQYDSLGRLKAVYAINPANQGLVQLAGLTYDAISRKKTESLFKRYDDAGNLKEKYTTTYDYYTSGNIKAETTTDITNKTVSKYEYIYEQAVDDTINGVAAKYSKATTLALGDNTISTAPIKRYYDKMGFLVKDEVVHYENGTNKTYTNTYKNDYLGNCKEVKEARAYDEGWTESYTALFDYDYASRVVKETNALGKFIQTNYDSLGRVTGKSDYYGRFTNYTYDKLGRLIKAETPFEGSYTSKTKYYYDNNGNKTRDLVESNVPGQAETYDRTDYGYDSRNRLIKAVKYDTNGATNYTQYHYDAAGNKTKMFTGLTAEVNTTTESGTDNSFSVTRYDYNYLNQMTTMTDPLGMVTRYNSDITGNVISMTDRMNNVTNYSYNVNNQLLNQSVVKDGVRQEIQYNYDILGNRNSMIDETGTHYYAYDDLSRLKTETEPGAITKTYSYDAAGNRKSFALTKNGTAEISIEYTYDKLNRLSTVIEGGQTTTYGYDDNGNRKTLASTSGLAADYTYNSANKLTGLTNKKGTSILSQFAYTYYINGNMSGKTENTGTTTYAYDGLGRLKTETQPGSVVYSYLYDDYHNRSTMTVTGGTDPGTTTYAYDKNNRLLTTQVNTGTNYKYDYSQNFAWSYHGFSIPVDTGAEYTYSFDAYISTDANMPNTGTTFIADGEQGFGCAFYYDNTKKGIWQHFEYTAATASNVAWLLMYPTTSAIPATTGYIEYKNVEFKKKGTSTNLFPQSADNNGFTLRGNGIFQCIGSTDITRYQYDNNGNQIY